MNNESMQKINKMGKVAFIVSKIATIVLIIGLVCSLGVTIASVILPDDIFEVKMSGEAQVAINKDSLGNIIGKKAVNQIVKNTQDDFNMNMNGIAFNYKDMNNNEDMLYIDANTDAITISMGEVSLIMLAATFLIINMLVLLVRVKSLCKDFRDCKTPFEEKIINKMRTVAIHLIPWAIVNSICMSLMKSFAMGKVDVSIGINLPTVTAVLIVLMFTYVFQYGAKLQQESDETL